MSDFQARKISDKIWKINFWWCLGLWNVYCFLWMLKSSSKNLREKIGFIINFNLEFTEGKPQTHVNIIYLTTTPSYSNLHMEGSMWVSSFFLNEYEKFILLPFISTVSETFRPSVLFWSVFSIIYHWHIWLHLCAFCRSFLSFHVVTTFFSIWVTARSTVYTLEPNQERTAATDTRGRYQFSWH